MGFSPELDKAGPLYLAHGREIFALCYLHAEGPVGAGALVHTLLCDLSSSRRCWRRASSGTPGLFRCVHTVCMEQSYKRPARKKKNAGQAQGARHVLPFTMTDALRALLKLPARFKTPLYLRLALGWGAQDTAAVIGGGPRRAERLVARGLKRAKLTEERARQALLAIAPAEGAPEEMWDGFLAGRDDRTFAGMQRLRLFKRCMDRAIPYIALGVVAFCVLAYQGVERGWFSGQSYISDLDLESYNAPQDEAAFPTGSFTVFAPDPNSPQGLVKYLVAEAPQSIEALLRQMVALGGAPEGTTVQEAVWSDLSCGTPGPAIDPSAKGLALTLSEEAGKWFSSAAPQEQERMLLSMAKTLRSSCPELETLALVSSGKELTAENGATAQSYLDASPPINRAANAPYRP